MNEMKYFPLVDGDTEGNTKIPMFPVNDEQKVADRFNAYLEEIVAYRFRMNKKKGHHKNHIVHCPYCGKEMTCISPEDGHTLNAYYKCEFCLKEVKEK